MDESGGAGQLEQLRAGHDADAADRRHAARSAALIEFQRVGHTYRSLLGRTVRAVDDFSLSVREGEVLGLAGPNGAGKSTLISLLLGYIDPSDGSVTIDGVSPRAFIERHGIGYLSELIAIPARWKLEQALQRYAVLAGVAPHRTAAAVERSIGLLGLDDHSGKRVKQLSKGTLQRLGLAQALLREERVIILDEPTHGLDPVWTQRFRDIVEVLRRPDRSIFIASHNLDELQRLADRVAIIDEGRLQRVVDTRRVSDQGTANAASNLVPYTIAVSGGDGLLETVFPGCESRGRGEWALPAMELAALNAGLQALLQRGVLIESLRPTHSMLEQHFREAVRDD